MAKLLFVAPYESIFQRAQEVIDASNYPNIDQIYFCYCHKQDITPALQIARTAQVDIILARGQQSVLLREQSELPVVELLVTSGEAAKVVMEARRTLGVECPTVGIVGMGSSFFDLDTFNKTYQAELRPYHINDLKEIPVCMQRAMDEGVQLIAGGEVVCQTAARFGIPSTFLESDREGILNAMTIAEFVASACDITKKNAAQMQALLDYSFNGIIKTDAFGCVTQINQLAENLLRVTQAQMLGQTIEKLIPELHNDLLDEVLQQGQSVFSRIIQIGDKVVAVNITPVQVEEEVQGMILSLQPVRELRQLESDIKQAMLQQGYFARFQMSNLDFLPSKEMRNVVQTAKLFARYTAPVLIEGEEGTERHMLAEAIHRASLRRDQSFVFIDCDCLDEATMCSTLFGRYQADTDHYTPGLLAEADGGTAMLANFQMLTSVAQKRLLHYLTHNFLVPDGDYKPIACDLRLIAVGGQNLADKLESGVFSADLYYALNVLRLEVPPLRAREGDIRAWGMHTFDTLSEKYARFIRLTEDAWEELERYPWKGNFIQLQSFCLRILLMAPRRTVNETFLREQLELAYPAAGQGAMGTEKNRPEDPRAKQIQELMDSYNGDREAVAAALNISRTTLWRRCKQYGILD